MAQAIVDPGELERFRQQLKAFNNDLQTRMAAMHGQLSGLSQSCAIASRSSSPKSSSRRWS